MENVGAPEGDAPTTDGGAPGVVAAASKPDDLLADSSSEFGQAGDLAMPSAPSPKGPPPSAQRLPVAARASLPAAATLLAPGATAGVEVLALACQRRRATEWRQLRLLGKARQPSRTTSWDSSVQQRH